jgi:hypothetical protein
VPAESAGLWRYETADEIALVAGACHPAAEPVKWPVGTRTPIAGITLASTVLRTSGPARMDTYENVAGVLATQVRAAGIHAAVGVRVVVDGRVWGLAAIGSARPGPMPPDTEVRISRFAELIASVVVTGYRDGGEGSSSAVHRSVRSWLIRCSRGDPLTAGVCGRSLTVCGCRPVVLSWS